MNEFEYYTFVKGLQGLPRYKKDLILDFNNFKKVVRSIFTHRRKKIRNCLKLTFPELDLIDLEHMDYRAEVLSPKQIANLSNQIFERLSE